MSIPLISSLFSINSMLRSSWTFCAWYLFKTSSRSPIWLLMICSDTWEKGPWPISCKSPANRRLLICSLLISRCDPTLPARCITPNECSNLVWCAPGYTRLARASCFIPLNRWNIWVSMICSSLSLYLMKPWTGSLTFISSRILPIYIALNLSNSIVYIVQ